MANTKKITVDQLEGALRRANEKFIDKNAHEQANSYCKYVVKNTDSVVDIYGDGYAYEISVNSDFSDYVEHIQSGKAVCFDLSEVLGVTTLAFVSGFKVSTNNGAYLLVGDCTSLDVWYHFTLTSTTWPTA